MLNTNFYRNKLLKKYIIIGLIVSLLLAPVYYNIGHIKLAISLIPFSIGMIFLLFKSNNLEKYTMNSRVFMVLTCCLFIIGFIDSTRTINSTYFLLLFPIASFSIRGLKEGIFWTLSLFFILLYTYICHPIDISKYSILFLSISMFMVSYLLYFYRYYEMKTFKDINKELEKIIKQRTKELQESNEQLKKLASIDSLTNINNRAKIEEIVNKEFNRFKRNSKNFCLVLLDIDYFKKVNDTHGHQIGDKVLIEFATLLKNSIRKTDFLGRYGGEEFLILFPESNIKEIEKLLESIRIKIESYQFDFVGNKTASFGLTQVNKNDTIESIIQRADKALYKAKEKGRNNITILI